MKNKRPQYYIYIIIATLIGVSFVYFLNVRNIFPDKFFFDNSTLRQFLQGSGLEDKAFQSTAKFYRFLGFSDETSFFIESLMSWFIYTVFLLLFCWRNYKVFVSPTSIVLVCVWTVIYGAYVSVMGKDQVSLVLVGLIPLVLGKNLSKYSIWLVVFSLLYGMFFRTYWLIIILLAVIASVPIKIKKSRWVRLFLLVMGVVAVFAVYRIFLHESIMDVRVTTNASRIGSDYAQSIIQNVVPSTNIFADILNWLHTLLILLFPVGITGVSQILYYGWFWLVVFVIINKQKGIRLNGNLPTKYLINFVVSFVLVQAMFEPDLGSALRHQVVLFPIVVMCLVRNESEGLKIDEDIVHKKRIVS
jgi:hypothetical protein